MTDHTAGFVGRCQRWALAREPTEPTETPSATATHVPSPNLAPLPPTSPSHKHTASHTATRTPFQVRLGAEPPPTAGGYPLRTLPEATEVLLKPKMYYELQRGVKKLRF